MLSRFSRVRLFATPWTVAHQAPLSKGFPVKNTGVSCRALVQQIFLTQGLNLHVFCLLHWQAGPVPLAPLGKPRYIFTTNLCGNDSQTWFKDEDTEVWKLGDVIRPQSPLRQSRNTIVGSRWHSVYTNILSLAASGMISWKPLHIASSLQILPLLSTNIVPWRQRHIKRSLHVYKAWHYFVRMLSGVCTLNMLKGRVEINRTEQNQMMLMQSHV